MDYHSDDTRKTSTGRFIFSSYNYFIGVVLGNEKTDPGEDLFAYILYASFSIAWDETQVLFRRSAMFMRFFLLMFFFLQVYAL